jgi:hypothetical protein
MNNIFTYVFIGLFLASAFPQASCLALPTYILLSIAVIFLVLFGIWLLLAYIIVTFSRVLNFVVYSYQSLRGENHPVPHK